MNKKVEPAAPEEQMTETVCRYCKKPVWLKERCWFDGNNWWCSGYAPDLETHHEHRPLVRARTQPQPIRSQSEREQRLEKAIRWALGELDDFPLRQPGEGAFWWRKELSKRAALEQPDNAARDMKRLAEQ